MFPFFDDASITFEAMMPRIRKYFLDRTNLSNSKESRQLGLIGKALIANPELMNMRGQQIVSNDCIEKWFPYLVSMPKIEEVCLL